jgi:phenylacetate-CoA ligase
VTSLGDRLEPHIRYRTGDLYRLMPACPCGHSFPAVRHEGRGRHVLQLPDGGTITPKAFDDLVGPDPLVIAYRMHQRSSERFHVKYIPSPQAPHGLDRRIGERVRDALGRGASVTVESTPYIASERSGKFLSCVSDLPWMERTIA